MAPKKTEGGSELKPNCATECFIVAPLRYHLWHGAKRKSGNAEGKIDTDLPFNRERLQRDGPVRSADKNVGIGTEPDGNASACSDVSPGQCAMMVSVGRGQHRPYHGAAGSHSEIETKPVDVTCIVFRRSAGIRSKTTSQFLVRSGNQPKTG